MGTLVEPLPVTGEAYHRPVVGAYVRKVSNKGARRLGSLVDGEGAGNGEVKVCGSTLTARRQAGGVYFVPVDFGHDSNASIHE